MLILAAQKYHSIQQSGKRLEDVLSEAELRQLRGYVRLRSLVAASNSGSEHGDLVEVEETADRNDHADHEAEVPQPQANGDSGDRERDAPAEVCLGV